MTLVAGVIGSPARHSLSPTIHTAWLDAAGIDGRYGLHDIPEADFETRVAALRSQGLVGLNVTVPFKERALALADVADPAAREAGAANLLCFADGRIDAANTDGIGVLYALRPLLGGQLKGRRFVMLGAGGAAAGGLFALAIQAGAQVRLVNRTRARAQTLADRFGGRVTAHDWGDISDLLPGADGLINATTMGLEGLNPLELDLTGLPAGAVVMDMVYKPLETALLRRARQAGHPTIDGLDMLIGQARPSFEAFFGQAPDPDLNVRALCLAELERRAS